MYIHVCIYIYVYMDMDSCIVYTYIYIVALTAQWLGCQPQEAEVLGSILTTSN